MEEEKEKKEKKRHFEIPPYSYFTEGNFITGSAEGFNYRVDLIGENLHAKIWFGELCSDLSEAATESDFAVNAGGYEKVEPWIDEQFARYRHGNDSPKS